jgi:hypothetical protein
MCIRIIGLTETPYTGYFELSLQALAQRPCEGEP